MGNINSLNLPVIANKLVMGKWMLSAAVHAQMFTQFSSFLDKGMDLTQYKADEGTEYTPGAGAPIEDMGESGLTEIIEVSGILDKDPSFIEKVLFGSVDVDDISNALDHAAEDPTVKNIVLNFNSPGGNTMGIEELGRKIKYIDENIKPVFAWTEKYMCSAAYWLGSQARWIGMTPSAAIGNVGVYCLIINETEALKQQGITIEPFVSGDFKAMGHSWHKLTDEEKAILNADVEKQGEKFRSIVSAKRPNLKYEDMQGLTNDGEEALSKHSADEVDDSFGEFLTNINKESLNTMKTNKVKVAMAQDPSEVANILAADLGNKAVAVKAPVETVAEAPINIIKEAIKAVSPVAVVEEVKVPDVAAKDNNDDEDDDMVTCEHCKGKGKLKKAISEPDKDEAKTEEVIVNGSIDAKTITADQFHALYGSKAVKHNSQTEFYKLCLSEITKQNS